MHVLKRIYKGLKYERAFPDAWDALTARHLLIYTRALSQGLEGLLLRIRVLEEWLQLPKKVFKSMLLGEVYDLLPKLDFLFDTAMQCPKLILEKFTHWRIYYGPGEFWKNMTVGEFSFVDGCLEKMKNEELRMKNEGTPSQVADDELCKLIAGIYRPVSIVSYFRYVFTRGDIRCKFNGRMAAVRAKRMKTLPAHVKKAILFNYLGWRSFVVSRYDNLFNTGEEKKSNKGWVGVIFNMAGPELGTMDEVENMLFYNAMEVLNEVDKNRRASERKGGGEMSFEDLEDMIAPNYEMKNKVAN